MLNDEKLKKLKIAYLFEALICVFYIWYFLPVVNATLSSGVYKILFFACFALGMVGLAFVYDRLKFNSIVINIVVYFIIFSIMTFMGVDDAHKHIRVSFTFWGTALLYFAVLDDKGRIRIGKFLFLLFIATCITSSIGVILDNSAARTIAHASAEDTLQLAFRQKNIANIYLFQGMVFFVPALIMLPQTKKGKIICWLLILAILLVLLAASFTISLLVYLLAVVLSFFIGKKGKKLFISLAVVSLILLFVVFYGYDLLTSLSKMIKSEVVAVRIEELRDLIYNGEIQGDVGLRGKLYLFSCKTFLENPFGVGAFYSYIQYENGIGYHSQLLDDLARYGIFAIIFYGIFLKGYYTYLKKQWKKLDRPQIALIITLLYLIFLILNLGFRSAEESVIVLFLMPVLPDIILMHKSKRQSKIKNYYKKEKI